MFVFKVLTTHFSVYNCNILTLIRNNNTYPLGFNNCSNVISMAY